MAQDTTTDAAQNPERQAAARDLYRPEYHFTPERHWMNDPNGLVYLDGEYHLFYQHNPFGDTPGNIGWGHALSPDLMSWTHLPMAIPAQDGIMAFSGSAVVDWGNSSGFGENGQPPLVAIYTGHHEGGSRQDQRLAYSTDRGRSWRLYAGNPVLDIGLSDFRDPKVFWHAPSERWVMVVVLSEERKVRFYRSSDLKVWTFLSDFGPAGAVGGVWEVPDLFELLVRGSNERRWVLKVDVFEGGPWGGSAAQLFLGQFDGECFVPDEVEGVPNWVDHGKDFYAAVSWSDLPATDGRRLWLGWMSNWQYARDTPTHPWRGALTVPRSLSLERVAGKLRLVQSPIRELERWRCEHHDLSGLEVSGTSVPLRVRGSSLEIIADFEFKDADAPAAFGLKVRVGMAARTLIGYDAQAHEVFVDRRDSGNVGFHSGFAGRHGGTAILERSRLRLHVFVDESSVEVFANDGQVSITDLIFPGPNDDGLEVYAVGGRVRANRLEVWSLKGRAP